MLQTFSFNYKVLFPTCYIDVRFQFIKVIILSQLDKMRIEEFDSE